MNTKKRTCLKYLLSSFPRNTILTSKYLTTMGFSHDLQIGYERNGWLKRVSQGAYTVLENTVDLNGAIYALQEQLGLSFHIGGLTALNEQYGILHNIPFSRKQQLYGYRGEKLPKWFNTLYEDNIELNLTAFLPKDIGLIKQNHGDFKTKVSSLERAVLEMLYLVPEKVTLNEAYQLIESLTAVKPKEFQKLLEECASVKIKRLFLYMAETVGHSWLKRINQESINLGKGVREITKGGKYNKKYNIIIGDIEAI